MSGPIIMKKEDKFSHKRSDDEWNNIKQTVGKVI